MTFVLSDNAITSFLYVVVPGLFNAGCNVDTPCIKEKCRPFLSNPLLPTQQKNGEVGVDIKHSYDEEQSHRTESLRRGGFSSER